MSEDFYTCEFCRCHTNAKVRACCDEGNKIDRIKSNSSLEVQEFINRLTKELADTKDMHDRCHHERDTLQVALKEMSIDLKDTEIYAEDILIEKEKLQDLLEAKETIITRLMFRDRELTSAYNNEREWFDNNPNEVVKTLGDVNRKLEKERDEAVRLLRETMKNIQTFLDLIPMD
jgi:hypothetical protein